MQAMELHIKVEEWLTRLASKDRVLALTRLAPLLWLPPMQPIEANLSLLCFDASCLPYYKYGGLWKNNIILICFICSGQCGLFLMSLQKALI